MKEPIDKPFLFSTPHSFGMLICMVNVLWLSNIVSNWLWLVQEFHRGRSHATAESIVVSEAQFAVGLLILLPLVNLAFWLSLRQGKFPAPLFYSPPEGAGSLHSMICLLMIVAILLSLGTFLPEGGWQFIPAHLGFIYMAVSARAAILWGRCSPQSRAEVDDRLD